MLKRISYFLGHLVCHTLPPAMKRCRPTGPVRMCHGDSGLWLPLSSGAKVQTLDSPARTETGIKRGPKQQRGTVRAGVGRGEPGSSHRVRGEGFSAHSDLQGWREGGRGSTFLLLLSQGFLKAGLPVLCCTSGFPLGTRLSHTHTWARFKASSTRVLLVTLSPKSSVCWK